MESDFDKVDGVLSTTSGYTGGNVANPTYEQVSGKHTGHAEAVEIVFDPKKVSYEKLVEHFWRTIDPTTKDRQFCDAGTPYRTAIFAQDADAAAASRRPRRPRSRRPSRSRSRSSPTSRMGGPFYPAEDYHQDYYRRIRSATTTTALSCGRDARLKELWGSQAATH